MSTSWCVFSSREAVPDEGGIILCTTFVQGSALADLQEQFGRSINRSYLKPLTTTVITAKSLLCKYILEDFKLYLSMPCLPFYCLEKNFSRKSQLSSYTESIKVLFRSEGKRRKKQREVKSQSPLIPHYYLFFWKHATENLKYVKKYVHALVVSL